MIGSPLTRDLSCRRDLRYPACISGEQSAPQNATTNKRAKEKDIERRGNIHKRRLTCAEGLESKRESRRRGAKGEGIPQREKERGEREREREVQFILASGKAPLRANQLPICPEYWTDTNKEKNRSAFNKHPQVARQDWEVWVLVYNKQQLI